MHQQVMHFKSRFSFKTFPAISMITQIVFNDLFAAAFVILFILGVLLLVEGKGTSLILLNDLHSILENQDLALFLCDLSEGIAT